MKPCIHCGATVAKPSRWFVMSNGSTHLREDCAGCGRWRKWVPKTPENVAVALPPEQPKVEPIGPLLFDPWE